MNKLKFFLKNIVDFLLIFMVVASILFILASNYITYFGWLNNIGVLKVKKLITIYILLIIILSIGTPIVLYFSVESINIQYKIIKYLWKFKKEKNNNDKRTN